MAGHALQVGLGLEEARLKRSHRRAHIVLVLGSAALGASFFAAGWSMRTERPVPQPFPILGAPAAEPEWTVVLRTPQGPAVVSYLATGHVHASLPPDLDAAEPGLIVETAGRADTLGSLNGVRAILSAPAPLAGGQLVLADLARGLRLAEASAPGGAP